MQNRAALRRYNAERQNLAAQIGEGELNEKLLFHGTRATPPLNVAQDLGGFDDHFSSPRCLYGLSSPSSPVLVAPSLSRAIAFPGCPALSRLPRGARSNADAGRGHGVVVLCTRHSTPGSTAR